MGFNSAYPHGTRGLTGLRTGEFTQCDARYVGLKGVDCGSGFGVGTEGQVKTAARSLVTLGIFNGEYDGAKNDKSGMGENTNGGWLALSRYITSQYWVNFAEGGKVVVSYLTSGTQCMKWNGIVDGLYFWCVWAIQKAALS